MPSLIVEDENQKLKEIELLESTFMIGKKAGNDLVLNRTNISREHCMIVVENDQYFIRDLASRNGTFVNGSRIATDTVLEDGAKIHLGDFTITFRGSEPSADRDRSSEMLTKPDAGRVVRGQRVSGQKGREPGAAAELKKKIHVALLKKMDLKRADYTRSSEQELREKTTQVVTEIVRSMAAEIPESLEHPRLIKEVVDEAVGLGPLEDLLADDTVDEIMVNGPEQIYVERKGKLELSDLQFTSDQQVYSTIRRIIAPIGRRIDETSPMVDARLADGSRVNAIISPLSLTGPTVTIRKFSAEPFVVGDLIGFGALNEKMATLLRICVENRRNICISGGTGSGKTTLLNVVSAFIPRDERIVTIEDAAELKLPQEHVVSLESRPANIEGTGAIPIRKLVINSLRMRPDRIIVGECRGGEALDMLQAMNTGHDGSLTTLHANNPRDALARLETLVLMAGIPLPSKAIREQISSAINLIVHVARYPDGSRKISHITEVTGMEGDVITLQEIFKFDQRGFDAGGKVLGEHCPSGAVPDFIHGLRDRGITVDMELFS